MTMNLTELARDIGAAVHTPGRTALVEREQVYAGDRISDLLNAAAEHVLLVSNLASSHLVRVAELLDVPGVCLVSGQRPDEIMLTTARAHDTLVMTSPVGLFETCGRIFRALEAARR
jgi:hypothetical protein